MGEIFERLAPSSPFEWTGERLTTSVSGQIEIEHLHRYFLARELCRGLDVLDVAAGEGYGTALLAKTAKSAVGVELAPEVARHAAASYRLPNLRFLEGDARALPLPDASVDVVTSFETIEHFYEHDQFLSEIRRVLRPGGRLIVSSPDRDVYSPPGHAANPYHVRELTRDEFKTLLGRYFAHVSIFGQRPMIGSAMLSETDDKLPPMTFERRGENHFEASPGLPRAVYLLAIASDDDRVTAPSSVFVERDDVGNLLSELAAGAAQADLSRVVDATRAELNRAIEEAGLQARTYVSQIEAASQQIREQEAAAIALRGELEAARADLRAAKDQISIANAQRDLARVGLRRAGIFAESRWRPRVEELEARLRLLQDAELEAELWRGRYHALRGRLEMGLRRSGMLHVARIVMPRPVRRRLLDLIRRRTIG